MPTTSIEMLKEWFAEGKREKATHMIVVCDTFSYEDYPVYVKKGESVDIRTKEYRGKNMQTVMAVYNLNKPLKGQM